MLDSMEILRAMEGADGRQVLRTGMLLGYTETREHASQARRFGRTALLAAVIAAFLGLTACAVGLSVHQKRQQELRRDLKIDASGTASYVEYPVPTGENAATGGVTILSAISDGQEQKVYVNVCPVTEEEIDSYPVGNLHFAWRIEGTDFSGFAAPQLPSDLTLSGDEEILRAVKEYAYDSGTESLTLECWIWAEKLHEIMESEGVDSVSLGLGMYLEKEQLRDFGTAVFTPTEEEVRIFDFGPVVYHDAELNRDIEIVALELTPVSAVWRVRYEGAAAFHTPEADWEAYRDWSILEDKVGVESELHFSDGTVFSTGGALTCPYENGTVNLYTGWGAAIDIHDVQRITLGDQVLWEA